VAVIDRTEDQLPRSNAEVFVVEERLLIGAALASVATASAKRR